MFNDNYLLNFENTVQESYLGYILSSENNAIFITH